MSFVLVFIILLALVAVVSTPITALFTGVASIIFFSIVKRLSRKAYPATFSVYFWSCVACLTYTILCFGYMRYHGYSYLLIYDTDNVFLPVTQQFLASSKSFKDLIINVWSSYSFFDRFQTGYYTHLTTWGYLAKITGADLYFVLQVSHLLVNSFIPILLYRILFMLGVDERRSVKYSLLIFCLSILFFYSTVILRDAIVALLILFIFYISLHELSVRNVTLIGVSIFLITTLRIETGLLCSIFAPTYFYIWRDKTKKSLWPLILVLLFFVGIAIVYRYLNSFISTYQFVNEAYIEGVDEGSGVIALLQKIPILKYPLSCLYTALQPIPCWTKMAVSASFSRVECYNIMCFPVAIAAFFNFYITIYFCFYLFEKKRSDTNRLNKLYLLLIPGLFFLFIQSAVVAQRRVMSIYLIFYIIWAIKHSEMSASDNRRYLNFSVIMFMLLQFVTGMRNLL